MMKFKIGEVVDKFTGDYTGPGVIRDIVMLPSGRVRYLVGHRIAGGSGEFLHIYSEANLREIRKCANPTYEIVGEGIRFSPCGITSYHPMDVKYRFCALCKAYVETPTPGADTPLP